MKTAKLVIGIISIVLFVIITFQSCAASLVEAIDGEGSSGAAGTIVGICMLVAGIVGICTRKNKGGGIFTGVVYAFAALMCFANSGVYGDLVIWSALCLIFAVVFIVGSVRMPGKKAEAKEEPKEE